MSAPPACLRNLPEHDSSTYAALMIERHLPCREWARAVTAAGHGGIPVDTDYLRDRYRIVATFAQVKERALREQREAKRA